MNQQKQGTVLGKYYIKQSSKYALKKASNHPKYLQVFKLLDRVCTICPGKTYLFFSKFPLGIKSRKLENLTFEHPQEAGKEMP